MACCSVFKVVYGAGERHIGGGFSLSQSACGIALWRWLPGDASLTLRANGVAELAEPPLRDCLGTDIEIKGRIQDHRCTLLI